ncbi:MAG: DUF4236 domain-containing protein [Erysipelotrichaceae bacterium]|nr:DUF4236 domain-containing protein [Erysipelotrichaceae bacterium]
MGIRFAKSIKINNFLKLNFSKSGLSATVGKKGASVNIGGKGTYLNLSPSAVGINGTGISYRQRITGGKSSAKKKKTKDTNKETVVVNRTSSLRKQGSEQINDNVINNNEVIENEAVTVDVVEEYNRNLEETLNIHKYTDNVVTKKEFARSVEQMDEGLNKELYRLSMEGDEDTVENLVSSFMNNLALPYDVRVNYELEDNVLYVDLDLPEIEDLETEYPTYVSGRLVYKQKKSTQLKEEYAKLVLSLGVFLSANYFNLSSYIDEIVMSAFTSARNRDGELVDQYLYSIRYTRDIFEQCDLSRLDDLFEFILRFPNRINMAKNYSFRSIKPYETKIVVRTNELIEEAVLGLKELGYKKNDIEAVLPKLSEYQYESSGEYLKQALRLMKE